MSDFSYTVQRAQAVTAVRPYLEKYVDVPTFLSFCQVCPSYDSRWSCPSFDFDPMALWQEYRTLHLFARFLTPGNRDGEALIAALKVEKEHFLTDLLAMEQSHPGSLALSCGSCECCTVCTRVSGKPCIKPERLRYSIEALGGDVGKTALDFFGKPLLWVKDGVAPDYLMLVGGLLLREDAL